MGLLDADFTPLTDVRGTAEFRAVIARNLLLKFWITTVPASAGEITALEGRP
jgi:xanthine dehydrogenase small subunit